MNTKKQLASLSDGELAELKDQANAALMQSWLHAASPEELMTLIHVLEADRAADRERRYQQVEANQTLRPGKAR